MLYPVPQKIKTSPGRFILERGFCLLFKGHDREIFGIVKGFCEKYTELTGEECYPVADYCGKLSPAVLLKEDGDLRGEEYKIKIGKRGICLSYKEPVGAFRAMTTLLQLIRDEGKALPFVDIHDYPDIKRRGFMLDISRSRVPEIGEIFKLVDLMAELKYNELQLYLENHAFEYAAYPEYTEDIEGLTPFEVMRLAEYCRERYIELVPNQNSFGHLYSWVQKPELRELELYPDNFCINPLDPRSLQLLNNIYDSLLPCFESELFNVGCDEVGGLGESEKTKDECLRLGGEVEVYMNHLLGLHDMLKARGKRMMFWADVIFSHPEKIPALPKDMLALFWGYEADTDFDKAGRALSEAGLEFYFCPGTATWASAVGDNDKARENIFRAARGCKKHGGAGVLLTDWGDAGHCQFFVISYIPLAYCGGACWNVKGNEALSLAADFVDGAVFKMKNGSLSSLLLRGGRIHPKSGNCTDAFLSLLVPFEDYGPCARSTAEGLAAAKNAYRELEREARLINLGCEGGGALVEEFCCDLRIAGILIDMLALKLESRDKGKIRGAEKKLAALEKDIKEAEVLYKRLWAAKNHICGSELFWKYVRDNVDKIKAFCKARDGEKSRG